MSVQQTYITTLRRSAGDLQASNAITADAEIEIPSVAIAASGTPKVITFAYTSASLAALFIKSTTVALSVQFKNSAGDAFGDPIVIGADGAWAWNNAMVQTFIQAINETPAGTLGTVEVTNTTTTLTGTVSIYGLYDATP